MYICAFCHMPVEFVSRNDHEGYLGANETLYCDPVCAGANEAVEESKAEGNPQLEMAEQMLDEELNTLEQDLREASTNEYYAPTVETVMVPVEVKYHYATGIVYSFTPPTREDVEKALKER